MRLRHATTAQDELSEKLASDFVKASPTDDSFSNGKDVDLFVKEFRDLRKTYHKRVMWGDRWTKGDVVWRDD
jgi:ESCRT-I complex subunit VPS37